MEGKLKSKLWAYIVQHNPELIHSTKDDYSVLKYLEQTISKIMPTAQRMIDNGSSLQAVEEYCLNVMIAELKPSRFLYIRTILSEDFIQDFNRLRDKGTLTIEILAIMKSCGDDFDAFEFDQKSIPGNQLRHAVIGKIHQHLP